MSVVYPELVGEIAKRNLKKGEIAKAVGISTRTLYSKLAGETDFTLSEADKIHKKFFPDMMKDDLFARSDE